jgi:hypothetical protein
MTSWLIRALDVYITHDSLRSRCRVLGVPFWPWDSRASLRRRIEWAAEYGYPSERAERHWLESIEGRMAMFEVRLMRALGVAK